MASFDTRLALGTSQRVKESKIFYQVDFDQLDLEAIYQVLAFVAKYPRHRLSLEHLMPIQSNLVAATSSGEND